jgi:hypothetical protein
LLHKAVLHCLLKAAIDLWESVSFLRRCASKLIAAHSIAAHSSAA